MLDRGPARWTPRGAEEELQAVLADLRRGIPNALATPPEEKPDPVFATFAFEWFERKKADLRPNSIADYEWQIVDHLLPYFGTLPLSATTALEIDRYRDAKVREGNLNATSINKTLMRLGQILDAAVEYRLLDRNEARGRNRRLKAKKYRGTWLDGADAIEALLVAAGDLDAATKRSKPYRRALLTVLVFAGLRIDEALSLRWRDVNLPARRLSVADSKTDAGLRTIDLRGAVVDVLLSLRAAAADSEGRVDPDGLVFATATGGKHSASNVRNRVLAGATEIANEKLAAADLPPLPDALTPHSLRRTFISILLLLGEDVPFVMDQAGHSDPKVTLGIYARVMRRAEAEKARVRALADGVSITEAAVAGPLKPTALLK